MTRLFETGNFSGKDFVEFLENTSRDILIPFNTKELRENCKHGLSTTQELSVYFLIGEDINYGPFKSLDAVTTFCHKTIEQSSLFLIPHFHRSTDRQIHRQKEGKKKK